jgi:hypothetical protein
VVNTGNAPENTVNSEMKPARPGRPREAKNARPMMALYSGSSWARPPNFSISRWWARS